MAEKGFISKSLMMAIADAIRSKAEVTGLLTPEQMIEAIAAISLGIDTSDATATSADILKGETAYVNGEKITGTIESQAAQTITPGTAEQTAVEAGKYAAGAVKVAGDSNLVAANILSGQSIFGVEGSLVKGYTIKTGTFTGSTTKLETKPITVTGLGGTPAGVIVFGGYEANDSQNTMFRVGCNIPGLNAGVAESALNGMYLSTTSCYGLTLTSDGFTIKKATSSAYAYGTYYYAALMQE